MQARIGRLWTQQSFAAQMLSDNLYCLTYSDGMGRRWLSIVGDKVRAAPGDGAWWYRRAQVSYHNRSHMYTARCDDRQSRLSAV